MSENAENVAYKCGEVTSNKMISRQVQVRCSVERYVSEFVRCFVSYLQVFRKL